jgi:hypothetical protein
VLLTLTLVVAAGVVTYLWTQRSTEDTEDNTPSKATCDFKPRTPLTVEEINERIVETRRSPNFLGADVGADFQLSDGRSLWVFGDTLRDEDFNGPRFVSNSMLIFGPNCATVVMPPDRGAIMPNRKDGISYWPMSIGGFEVPGGDMIGVGLMRVRRDGEGLWDFKIVGGAVARLLVPAGGVPELQSVTDIGPDKVDDSNPMWGTAVTVHDGYVYLYGTAHPGDDQILGWSLHVARARVADLEAPEKWEYWDGENWADDDRKIGTLIPAKDGVSRVLSVFEQDGSWYAVSKRNDFLGDELVIWKAPSPTGPFDAGEPAVSLPSADGVLQYMPLAHPAVLPEQGTVVVSWSRNVADLEQIAEDPALYRPEFARVPLP